MGYEPMTLKSKFRINLLKQLKVLLGYSLLIKQNEFPAVL